MTNKSTVVYDGVIVTIEVPDEQVMDYPIPLACVNACRGLGYTSNSIEGAFSAIIGDFDEEQDDFER